MPIRLDGPSFDVETHLADSTRENLVEQSREEIRGRVAKSQLERELIRKGIMFHLQQRPFMAIGEMCAAISMDLGYLITANWLIEEIAALEFHKHIRRRASASQDPFSRPDPLYSLSPPKRCEAEIFIDGGRHPVH